MPVKNSGKNDNVADDSLNDWEIVDASSCEKDDGEACCSMDGQDNKEKDVPKTATLFFKINNFSKMDAATYSNPVEVNDFQWQIMVMPRQHSHPKRGVEKCLGFFIKCSPKTKTKEWSCHASAQLRLLSKNVEIPNFTRKTSHTYTNLEKDWGYSCFIGWADIINKSQGYIKNDTVSLEAVIKVDPPKLSAEAKPPKVSAEPNSEKVDWTHFLSN